MKGQVRGVSQVVVGASLRESVRRAKSPRRAVLRGERARQVAACGSCRRADQRTSLLPRVQTSLLRRRLSQVQQPSRGVRSHCQVSFSFSDY